VQQLHNVEEGSDLGFCWYEVEFEDRFDQIEGIDVPK